MKFVVPVDLGVDMYMGEEGGDTNSSCYENVVRCPSCDWDTFGEFPDENFVALLHLFVEVS